MGNLDVRGTSLALDAQAVMAKWQNRLSATDAARVEKNASKALARQLAASPKPTEFVDGRHRIASDPPIVVPVR